MKCSILFFFFLLFFVLFDHEIVQGIILEKLYGLSDQPTLLWRQDSPILDLSVVKTSCFGYRSAVGLFSMVVKMDGAPSQLGCNLFSSSNFTIIQVLFIWLSSASVIDASGKNLVRKGRSQANLSKLMHYLISSISIAYREEMKKEK